MDKVARELAEEAGQDGRARYRKLKLLPGGRPADKPPGRGVPVNRAQVRPLARVGPGESAAAEARPDLCHGRAASANRCFRRRSGCTGSACRCARWSARCSSGRATRTRTARKWLFATSSSAAAGRCAPAYGPGAGHARPRAAICRMPRERHSPRNGRRRDGHGDARGMGRRRSEGRTTALERSTVSTDSSANMVEMDTWTGNRGCVAPEPAQPYWRSEDGTRLTFGELVEGLSGACAEEASPVTPKRSVTWLARPRSRLRSEGPAGRPSREGTAGASPPGARRHAPGYAGGRTVRAHAAPDVRDAVSLFFSWFLAVRSAQTPTRLNYKPQTRNGAAGWTVRCERRASSTLCDPSLKGPLEPT
jgi:hypothetical protein